MITRLIEAARNQDSAKIEELLSQFDLSDSHRRNTFFLESALAEIAKTKQMYINEVAFKLAEQEEHEAVEFLLLKSSGIRASMSSVMCGYVWAKNLDRVKDLYIIGANVNDQYLNFGSSLLPLYFGKSLYFHPTPLMIAAYQGDINTVRFLISVGADVNLVGEVPIEAQPLFIAMSAKHQAVIDFLISAGADTTFIAADLYANSLQERSDWSEAPFLFAYASSAVVPSPTVPLADKEVLPPDAIRPPR